MAYPIGYNCDVFTVQQTEEFLAWLDALKDKRAQIRIVARLRRADAGNLGERHPNLEMIYDQTQNPAQAIGLRCGPIP